MGNIQQQQQILKLLAKRSKKFNPRCDEADQCLLCAYACVSVWLITVTEVTRKAMTTQLVVLHQKPAQHVRGFHIPINAVDSAHLNLDGSWVDLKLSVCILKQ